MNKASKTALIALAVALPMAAPAFAQPSLTDQINSVYAVQRKQEAARRAEKQRLETQRQAEMRQAEKRRETERAAALRIAREREADAIADKERNERYVNKLRALKIEREELKLQAEKDRLARENDFINAKLRKQNAEANLIESRADANRNATSGQTKEAK